MLSLDTVQVLVGQDGLPKAVQVNLALWRRILAALENADDVVLVLDGFAHQWAHDNHIKNYAYGAMAFSVAVEVLNLRMRKNERRMQGE